MTFIEQRRPNPLLPADVWKNSIFDDIDWEYNPVRDRLGFRAVTADGPKWICYSATDPYG